MAIIRVAKSWGLTPGAFRALPYTEQLEMIAEYQVTGMMMEYEEQVEEQKRAAKAK